MFALINKLIPNTSATPPNQQAVSIFSLSLCLPQTQFHKRALKHKQPIAALHYTHKTLQLHVSVSLNTNEIRNSLSLSLTQFVVRSLWASTNKTRRDDLQLQFYSQAATRNEATDLLGSFDHRHLAILTFSVVVPRCFFLSSFLSDEALSLLTDRGLLLAPAFFLLFGVREWVRVSLSNVAATLLLVPF